MLVFCSLGLATPMRRPRYGLATTSGLMQFEIWPKFHRGPQRKPTKCLWWGERRQKSLK